MEPTIVPEDVEAKREELARPLAQLKWCVEFAYLDWSALPRYEHIAWLTGLYAFIEPAMMIWVARGANSGHLFGQVRALQDNLRFTFDSIVEGAGDVILFNSSVKLTWIQISPDKSGAAVIPAVLVDANVSRSFEPDEADWVGLQMNFAVAMLLREYPDRIRQCQAPRTKRMKHNLPQCSKVFVGRPQQVYCTQVCAARAWRVEREAQAAQAAG